MLVWVTRGTLICKSILLEDLSTDERVENTYPDSAYVYDIEGSEKVWEEQNLMGVSYGIEEKNMAEKT